MESGISKSSSIHKGVKGVDLIVGLDPLLELLWR